MSVAVRFGVFSGFRLTCFVLFFRYAEGMTFAMEGDGIKDANASADAVYLYRHEYAPDNDYAVVDQAIVQNVCWGRLVSSRDRKIDDGRPPRRFDTTAVFPGLCEKMDRVVHSHHHGRKGGVCGGLLAFLIMGLVCAIGSENVGEIGAFFGHLKESAKTKAASDEPASDEQWDDEYWTFGLDMLGFVLFGLLEQEVR